MTNDEYTPTTEQIRMGYARYENAESDARRRADFDRWLAAHDAEKIATVAARPGVESND